MQRTWPRVSIGRGGALMRAGRVARSRLRCAGAVRFYLGIFLATLSTVFVPVPEEATLLGAGYAVRLGGAGLAGALAAFGAAWLAVMIGDAFSYFVGRELLGRAL